MDGLKQLVFFPHEIYYFRNFVLHRFMCFSKYAAQKAG